MPSAHGTADLAGDPQLGPHVPKAAKAVAFDTSEQCCFQIKSPRLATDVLSWGDGGWPALTLAKSEQHAEPQEMLPDRTRGDWPCLLRGPMALAIFCFSEGETGIPEHLPRAWSSSWPVAGITLLPAREGDRLNGGHLPKGAELVSGGQHSNSDLVTPEFLCLSSSPPFPR